MRTKLIKLSIALAIVLPASCALFAQKQLVSIIPQPEEIMISEGSFVIAPDIRLDYERSDKDLVRIAGFLCGHLAKYHQLELSTIPESKSGSTIQFKIEPMDGFGGEGYFLEVKKGGIVITAPTAAGIFYGVQTLKQMLPPQSSEELHVPYVRVKDQPRFGWRGLMLDVGRHFFPVSYIKKYLDNMAMYKLNTFHWHLTEDQGWRIEIKQYPELTATSSWRDETILERPEGDRVYDGIGYGGFYTQEQIREIVQYAADRFITVIPEIEMPGHSNAALAGYPGVGCTGGPYQVQKKWGVMPDVYCAGKEGTFEFLQNILSEVCDLFPSPYVHIGGDECPKYAWESCPDCQQRIREEGLKDEHELQSYFIRRIEKFLISKNKKLIGWDEILEGGLAPQATVMSWRGIKGGIEAARQGHDVIMSPTTHCYFDYYQKSDKENEPKAIGSYLPLEKVYSYDPEPGELNAGESKHILGAQGNVWTEFIANTNKLEYMVFPRVCALSEVVWSPKGTKDFEGFQKRMETEYLRLKMYGINYCDHSGQR